MNDIVNTEVGAVDAAATPATVTEPVDNGDKSDNGTPADSAPPALTPEQELEKLRKERDAYEVKTKRQRAAYAELQRKYEETRAQTPSEPAKQDAPPREEDFDTIDDFVNAKAKYLAKQELEAFRKEQEESARQATYQQREAAFAESFNTKELELKEAYADYSEAKMYVAEALELASDAGKQLFAQYLMDGAENAPALMYHLGKNPSEIERLMSVSNPVALVRELTRIEMSIPSVKQPAKALKSSTPINPVRGVSNGDKSLSQMSGEELLKKLKIR